VSGPDLIQTSPTPDLTGDDPKLAHSRQPILRVLFYRTAAGREPIREWLRSLGEGLWEVRSQFRDSIARVIFMTEGDRMVLLHGFTKKSQKTPPRRGECLHELRLRRDLGR